MAQYFTDFGGHLVGGGLPAGFDQEGDPVSWQVLEVAGALGGKVVRGDSGDGQFSTILRWLDIGIVDAPIEILVKCRWNIGNNFTRSIMGQGFTNDTARHPIGRVGYGWHRNNATTSYYFIDYNPDTDAFYGAGGGYLLEPDGVVPEQYVWYWIRARYEADGAGSFTGRSRRWADGEVEPAAWQLEYTLGGTNMRLNGYVGPFIGDSAGTHVQVDIDAFAVGTDGDVATTDPPPPGYQPPPPGTPGPALPNPADLGPPRLDASAAGGPVLDLAAPFKNWAPGKEEVGSTTRFPSGAREAYVVRRFHLLGVTVEFSEAEWPAFSAFLEYVQHNAASFLVYPNRSDLATSYAVYLLAPTIDERWMARQGQYGGLYEADLVLESADGTRFDIRRFS